MRVIKKILFSLLLFLIIITGAGIILSYIYHDEVSAHLISELNKKIITKIDVEEVKFSLLRKFPRASVEFRNILIHPPASFKEAENKNRKNLLPGQDTLLFARHLFLEFNIRDIVRKDFQIKKLHADKGSLFLKVNDKGEPNYQFWKIDQDTSSANLQIQLQDLKFTDLNLLLLNQVSEFHLQAFTAMLNLKGNFNSKNFQLEAGSRLLVQKLSLGGVNYINNKICQVDLEMTVEEKQYRIEQGKIEISGIPMTVKGTFSTGENRTMDLKITGEELDLPSVIAELPVQYERMLDKYNFIGNLDLDMHLKGGYGTNGPPGILASVSVSQARIIPIEEKIEIKKLALTGHFSNGKSRNKLSTKLDVDNFIFEIGNNQISGSFWIENLVHPKMEILFNGSMDLAEVYQFLQPDSIEFMDGLVRTNVRLSGRLRDYKKITRRDIQNLKPVGQATLKDVGIKLRNDNRIFTDINGTLMFGTHIWVDDCSVNLNGNIFTLQGKLGNAIHYLMTGDKPLLIDATVTSGEFLLDRFRFYSEALEDSLNNKRGIHFPENLQMNLQLDLDKYSQKKFTATNLSGVLSYKPGILALQSINFTTMEGQVSGGGMMEKTPEGKYPVHIQSKLQDIDIQQLFTSFDNFGQKFIMDEHLKGAVSGEVEFSATWDENLKIEKETIIAESHLVIKQGELINFEPLLGLSKFIEVEELQHIRFSELENEILIKDEKVTIPQMEIQSSAINITLSGIHDFENNISYKSKVLLSELIFRKAKERKKENEEFGVVEDDELGRTSLYLTITGKPGDIKIAYDRKEAKQVISESIQEERKLLREILKEEFGWFKKDTASRIGAKDSTKTRFQILWDDSDSTTTDTFRSDTTKKPAFRIQWDDDETEVDTTGKG